MTNTNSTPAPTTLYVVTFANSDGETVAVADLTARAALDLADEVTPGLPEWAGAPAFFAVGDYDGVLDLDRADIERVAAEDDAAAREARAWSTHSVDCAAHTGTGPCSKDCHARSAEADARDAERKGANHGTRDGLRTFCGLEVTPTRVRIGGMDCADCRAAIEAEHEHDYNPAPGTEADAFGPLVCACGESAESPAPSTRAEAVAAAVDGVAVWALAHAAEAASDNDEAAAFWAGIRSGYSEAIGETENGGEPDERAVDEICDGAPDVYNYTRMMELIGTRAYLDTSELATGNEDILTLAGYVLYDLARLAVGHLASVAETAREEWDADHESEPEDA